MPALDIGLAALPNSPIRALRVIRQARVFHTAEMASTLNEHAVPGLRVIALQHRGLVVGIAAFSAGIFDRFVGEVVSAWCPAREPPEEKPILPSNTFGP